VSIRELVNILFSTSSTALQPSPMAQLSFTIDIDVDNNIIRIRSAFSSKFSSRELSTYSTTSFIPYHKRMEIQNNLLNKNIQESVDSFQISYVSSNGQVSNLVRETTDTSS